MQKNGIKGYEITFLPYLEFDANDFAAPFEVASRIIILDAIYYCLYNEADRLLVSDWLKHEQIWEQVSAKEKLFFEADQITERQRIDFSWGIESTYILAWSLGLITNLDEPYQQISKNGYEQLSQSIPSIGNPVADFLNGQNYIDKTRIIDENLFNELVTSYFRDLLFNKNENTSRVNKSVSYQRHYALNWVRRFMGIKEWDETDTST